MTLLLVLLALAATSAAAYCAFADGALLAIDEELVAPSPAVAALVERRERAHRALAFARILSQLLAGACAASALKMSDVPSVQLAPLVVATGILIVVFAESSARAAGDMVGASGVVRHLRFIHSVERLMSPFVWAGSVADSALESLLPEPPDTVEERESGVEQFREVVAAESGVAQDDALLLHGVFSLGDTSVLDIMVPRVNVVGLDQSWSWVRVVERVRASGHSRYVVYDRSLDNVAGLFHAKDLLPSVLLGAEPTEGWQSLIRPAQFIPATKPVDDQLRDFKASRRHLAVVVDEFGGTAGIVTLEDALEVIVGDIGDEHDVEEPDVRRESGSRFSVSARLTLDDLSELIGEPVACDDVNTVGGLVYAKVGGAPKCGDVVIVGSRRLVVERVVRRQIERVAIEPATSTAAERP